MNDFPESHSNIGRLKYHNWIPGVKASAWSHNRRLWQCRDEPCGKLQGIGFHSGRNTRPGSNWFHQSPDWTGEESRRWAWGCSGFHWGRRKSGSFDGQLSGKWQYLHWWQWIRSFCPDTCTCPQPCPFPAPCFPLLFTFHLLAAKARCSFTFMVI